jgi:phenylacetate-coenzyme A ligase PaaK-like adenylate-forming protein
MTKDDLLANWNEIVTDPRLTLELVEQHLQGMSRDSYLLDTYHAVASGGSSGRRGVFVRSWDAWATAFARGVRWSVRYTMRDSRAGTTQPVIAVVAAAAPTHMSGAMVQTFAAPFPPTHRFPVTMPMQEIVAGLNAVQPTQLRGYASALYELARQALAGNLRIVPTTVAPDGEPLFPEMRDTMERAWGVTVGCTYGTSEGCMTATGWKPRSPSTSREPASIVRTSACTRCLPWSGRARASWSGSCRFRRDGERSPVDLLVEDVDAWHVKVQEVDVS